MGFAPIPLFKVRMSPDATSKVAAVLNSGYIGQGSVVEDFERELARQINYRHIITVNSATSGLTLALRLAAKAGHEGEVLTQPITCTATNWPILFQGHRIRWVDTNPADGNMDLDDLERKLSPRTAAIMVVHWGGYPADLHRLGKLQDKCESRHGTRPAIIEDAAHAFGASFQNMPIGSHGNYCVFSFQAIKHLTTGDGGLLCTPDAETYRRAKLLRWYGIDRESKADFRCEGDIEEWGYKFHMNDINAAIGLSNLTDIDATLNAHRENARFYQLRLRDIPGVRLLNEDTDRSSAYWLFTLRASNRAGLAMKLKERGIACGQVHKRNDKYTCTARFDRGDLPGTDTFEREMLCIPVGWWVTPEDRDHIASSISEGW